MEFHKINLTEKRRKLDSAYKSIPYHSSVEFANYARTPLSEGGAYTDDAGNEVMDPHHGHRISSNARFCIGSAPANCADFFVKRVEAGEKSGSTVVNFRVPDTVVSRGSVGINVAGDPDAIQHRFKDSVDNSYEFISREENRTLGDEEKAKRKRKDNDCFKRLRELGLM